MPDDIGDSKDSIHFANKMIYTTLKVQIDCRIWIEGNTHWTTNSSPLKDKDMDDGGEIFIVYPGSRASRYVKERCS